MPQGGREKSDQRRGFKVRKLFGAQYTRYTNTLSRLSENVLLIVVLSISVVAFIGSFTYALYRLALYSKKLYALIFLVVAVAFFCFSMVRSIKDNSLSKKSKKLLKMLIMLLLILSILGLVMLYGAFLVRFPWVGAAIAPIFIFMTIFIAARWKLSSFFKRYFS